MTAVSDRGNSHVEFLKTDDDLPPVGVVDRSPMTVPKRIVFVIIGLLGAVAWTVIAVIRGEQVNAVWFVVAAVCTYIFAFRFYARLIENRIVHPRDDRATPAEILENGKDYMPTDRRVLFGHHFAAIAGAGPLVGPVLAAQMGYLPGTMWIIIGVVFAGAVQDFLVLWISTRRRGRSLGQMAREELGVVGGIAALIGVFVIMIIIIAVLALVVVNALAESPWGVFSIALTIPIALFMGVYLRYLRPGKVSEVSLIGVVLLLLAIISGGWVAETEWGADWFTLSKVTVAWLLIAYGLAASILPVWLLLAPRDYLSTFMKIGTIVLLAVGILIARPVLQMPDMTSFASEGNGPAFSGSLFPFLFITIACGALSGFHALISSGTTPKLLEKEKQMRMIGYGGMLTESFVAIMALVTACILDQHIYFALNAPTALTGGTPETAAAYVNGLGLSGGDVSAAELSQAATDVGEESIISRTGGAPTLAFGMSEVLHQVFGGESLKSFWYHFAIMFEALFILTTVDAGTRVARFMLSDSLGNLGGGAKKFRDPSWRVGAWICSVIVVAAWGAILLMGVTDPLGGINTLFPLFGIANQLLAAIALTVVLTVVVKKGLLKWAWIPALPLAFDLVVTMTASYQKIFSDVPAIGYWAQHSDFKEAKSQGLTEFRSAATPEAIDAVIRNTFIQGTLSIVFAVLVLIVALAGFAVCFKAIRAGGLPSSEEADVPSKLFAPSGFLPTEAEKSVQAEWDVLIADGTVRRPGTGH
ncbi:carbon starvation protein A [Rhodococcus sp. BP-149]|uniref:carbon starvation CstA family protein n=1 Tax=unclassified Rhodococcus (in: high G+C Gram-positive bacteria) TaxID=192944 RepID=UPI0006F9E3D1|nr:MULTISPECIES: carbon starvation CstA family protein [unclassified Rhodococcus (in: high G+C Gram-positive bacteria)]KQU39555.1 carbon starvation protein CstA [Rhodococcus sp. Leaf225]KQU43992.1 carbon starvation protein CstA [Rhodococcus sp. Leaf258]MBY6684172.1 carbon starvation protein A [Rhodococcus sp. BP-288]MBY6693167.1 carbon starvation protein A [Rhodococcus sp. BP-188]MBY6697364.1 carbon starvation protein A [Rhodococcus sp. BP-285]